jgi:hypothetical protein
MSLRALRFFGWWALGAALAGPASGLDQPEVTFKVFQFPANQIPRVDGQTEDWTIVPESYVVGTAHLRDASGKHPQPDPRNLDVRVRVGWVKGLNRLYFLYEASDDFWHFSEPGLHNDTFEVMVDGDASGGPFGDPAQRNLWTAALVGERRAVREERISVGEERRAIHGVHAQNYHVFTPAVDKDWAMVWGVTPWIKELPYANAATSFSFRSGEGGRLVLEFWITPFDYAGPEGPMRAVESRLVENKIIGLGWIVIDYDDATGPRNNGFWTLSRHRTAFGDATDLPAFRLMPLEPSLRPAIQAQWSFTVVDLERRLVAFKDESLGEVTAWRWDFGDGHTSTEQHPQHRYEKTGNFAVILDVAGPAGTSRRSKVWEIVLP